MTEGIEVIHLLNDATARRLWLFVEALRAAPFDRAVALARTAEAFVTGSTAEDSTHPDEPATSPAKILNDEPSGSVLADPPTKPQCDSALADDQRDRLLDHLARGARNAELATEFGMSLKRIQGIRMGCAREIAKRRAWLVDPVEQAIEPPQDQTVIASMEEIVRYLRQQDDVVVPQENAAYLVNGRFHMSAAELIERANRMRSRQRKPSFQIPGTAFRIGTGYAPKCHPVFWEEAASAEHGRSGFHKPLEIDTERA